MNKIVKEEAFTQTPAVDFVCRGPQYSMKSRTRQLSRPCTRSIVAVFVVVAGLLPGWASAACTFNSGYSMQTMALTLPDASVPRNVALGTVLASAQMQTVPGNFATCTAPGNADYNTNGGAAAPLDNTVTTNIPGIGLRFFFRNNNGLYPKFTTAGTPPRESYAGPWNWNGNGTGYFGVQVVVIGPVSSGQFNTVTNAYVFLDNLAVNRITVSSFKITTATCTTPNVFVSLNQHHATEFHGKGTATAATPFNLSLNNCPAGLNAITYEIDPITSIVSGTGNSVVTLDASSGATGIGVQLLDGNGNAFALSTPVTLSGYNRTTGGSYTIPLKARYYQTGSTISEGTANTAMVFLITYK